MKLKDYKPAIFSTYLNNPIMVDFLLSTARDLDDRKLLADVLFELSEDPTYSHLTEPADRFACWLATTAKYSSTLDDTMEEYTFIDNPIADRMPTSIMSILRTLEAEILINPTVNVGLRTKIITFFSYFGETALQ